MKIIREQEQEHDGVIYIFTEYDNGETIIVEKEEPEEDAKQV